MKKIISYEQYLKVREAHITYGSVAGLARLGFTPEDAQEALAHDEVQYNAATHELRLYIQHKYRGVSSIKEIIKNEDIQEKIANLGWR